MDERQDKSFNDAKRKADGKFGLFVARVALKTVLVFVVLFALLFSVGGGMFPRAYMDLYRSVGMYGKAAAYASAFAHTLSIAVAIAVAGLLVAFFYARAMRKPAGKQR